MQPAIGTNIRYFLNWLKEADNVVHGSLNREPMSEVDQRGREKLFGLREGAESLNVWDLSLVRFVTRERTQHECLSSGCG